MTSKRADKHDEAAAEAYERKRHPDTPEPEEAPQMRDLSGDDWAKLAPLLAERNVARDALEAHRQQFPPPDGYEEAWADDLPFPGSSREELVVYVEWKRLKAAFKDATARFEAALRQIIERETSSVPRPPAP